ncbi:Methyl-accepting chemotaxis protein [Candidatus Rhodobacter oscarellae]|uniref:Methyl-accepting chemotaxis protein n=1 Tax=Candidatus Rhodobacter oscarellae TaxID=1675527 RepID=A0A0J9GVM8_9RHOB|nr:DUF2937 family protein [Candidatus Rhodobacter lobularis]KMW57608.1 Methyl-accepting chemotaxis protein [Candidatus Rhodobacter lobularis]
MIRILAFVAGLGGAAGLSQFPEFSQQYLQRLGGAADGLRPAIEAFDATAADAGITRQQALDRFLVSDDPFLQDQGLTKAAEIERFSTLERNYVALREASPLQRLGQVYRLNDRSLIGATWDDFRPAVPVTIDGFICAAIGFSAVWLILMGLFKGIGAVIRRTWQENPTEQIRDLEDQMRELEDQIDGLKSEPQEDQARQPD